MHFLDSIEHDAAAEGNIFTNDMITDMQVSLQSLSSTLPFMDAQLAPKEVQQGFKQL